MPNLLSPPFRRALLRWFRKNGRDLPWRRTTDPYAVLISEVMLQQTQVATVLPYYREWLRRFPDFASLARAGESEVLHAWQGLGYYARARNLHAAARAIVEKFNDKFPENVADIRQLPGLGRYTANAVATFAFDQSVAVVEANIARLLARLLDLQLPIDSTAGHNAVWNLATELVPKRGARVFNSALMDLGALICVPRQPKCGLCPVRAFCAATDPASLPKKRARPPTKLLTERHAFITRGGRILLEQSENRWRGMWILPPLNKTPSADTLIYSADFPFTHHRITLAVYRQSARADASTRQRWFPIDSLGEIPLPSPHRRAVSHLISRMDPALNSATMPTTPGNPPLCAA
ncbi:MAG: A/G-specific adenine glycosylase [Verrucomicrobiota bacterium]|nr:A/G-specific adenine glycosylase [Verrucomicrobiota bacterium]